MGKLVVGLTGTFGSGKSSVAQLLRQFGARKVVDADRLAHEVFRPRHPLGKRIKQLFGIRGAIKRKAVAQQVFSNRNKRRKLEALIHPFVFRRIKAEIAQTPGGVIIVEVPLLFETRFDRRCDVTITVAAGAKNIARRLRQRGFSRIEMLARQAAQFSEQKKRQKSDFIILNTGSKKLLKERTRKIWKKLVTRYQNRY